MKKNFLFLTIALWVLPLLANHPGFDCSNVKRNSAEGTICSSDRLMGLDRTLTKLYRDALAKAPDRNCLRAEQRGWIKGRDDCWKTPDEKQCMIDRYRLRIEELRSQLQHAAQENPTRSKL